MGKETYHKLSMEEQALEKMIYYHDKGDTKKAEYFKQLAEKVKEVLKKNKQTAIEVERNKGVR